MSRLDDIEREAKERRKYEHDEAPKLDDKDWCEFIYRHHVEEKAAVDELMTMVKDRNDALRRYIPLYADHPVMKLLDGEPYDMRVELTTVMQERDQARADVKKLRGALITARGFIGDDAPGHPRYRIRDALVETESYESFR